jgi:dsRNA-specific ribonuclease
MLAKLTVLLGLHKYIVYYDSLEEEISKKDVNDYLTFSFVNPNFYMNVREIEPFEAPKILGDVFESVLGAIFEDGGLEAVMQVFKHLLSPLILFVAKFSKDVFKEPKEQLLIRAATEYRIRPKFWVSDSAELTEVQCNKANNDPNAYTTTAMMYTSRVLFRNGQVMCEGKGSTKI